MRKLDDKIELRREPGKSLNTSQDNFHLFKLSGVGTLKNMQRHTRTTSMQSDQNQNVLNQMNECLKECQKAPALRRKVQETLTTLEQSMVDYRAQRGMVASMDARKRLKDKAMKEEEAKERSVQVMLEQTAVLDSPIRAANL